MTSVPDGVGYCRKRKEWVRCTSKGCKFFEKQGLQAMDETPRYRGWAR